MDFYLFLFWWGVLFGRGGGARLLRFLNLIYFDQADESNSWDEEVLD